MIEFIRGRFENKSVVLLGFGREGQSTYQVLRRVFPDKVIAIADLKDEIRVNPLVQHDPLVHFITGEHYLESLNEFDALFRSPGIPVWRFLSSYREITPGTNDESSQNLIAEEKFTSQTELFLEYYALQAVGVTGTKGKSTTSSLIHHILKTAGKDVILAGNIGNPVFHFIDLITPQTTIILELSSHQLEFLTRAPHIGVLLNLFQEHLDAYPSFEAYQMAKINITRFQNPGDVLVYNADDALVQKQVGPWLSGKKCFPFSMTGQPEKGGFVENEFVCFSDGNTVVPVWKIHQDRFLRGEHNLKNILAAVNVAMVLGIEKDMIEEGIATFKGLEHRLEYVGEFHHIHFYNDSIATIPEACMEAVKAIPNVDTLIAGGFDRGIDYSGLAEFLSDSAVRNIILVGDAGKRMMDHLSILHHPYPRLFYINRFDDFLPIAFRETRPGFACLLSPAAASYDEFRNFEERGKRFRELVGTRHTASGGSEVAK